MAATSLRDAPDAAGDRPLSARDRLVVPMPGDRLASWLWALGITALAGLLRFANLGSPKDKIFDEVYYAKDAADLLHHGVELDSNGTGPGFVAHPPLGKWLIAIGEQLFGVTPVGWRFSAAVVGTLSILVLIRVARRMTRSTLLGCIAGVLLSLDGLHFVQSRVSMLDIFLMTWVLVAFACLLIDRDAMRRRLADDLPTGLRPWRLAAALCLGLALATKWSALWYIIAFALLTLAWDSGALRSAGRPRPFRAALVGAAPWALGGAVIVAVAYTLSWSGWFLTDSGWDRNYGSNALVGWIHYQQQILRFHTGLTAHHRYASLPWSWLLLGRPVAYYYSAPSGCGAVACSREVLAIGNPALWWAFPAALIGVAWQWLARRDWRAAAILVAVAAGFLPWLPYPHRTMFLFYTLPALPFLVLATTMCLGLALGSRTASMRRRLVGAWSVASYVCAVAVVFAFFHPVLVGTLLTYAQWRTRMWFPTWI
ncbi:MAG: phospholipid carrier-dependent glycosyltransferase [Mycobacteriales bacterium]